MNIKVKKFVAQKGCFTWCESCDGWDLKETNILSLGENNILLCDKCLDDFDKQIADKINKYRGKK